MRRVLLQMGLSVDGIVAGGPQGGTEAGARDEDEAVRTWKVKSPHQVGTHIMGRVTYEQMAAHWPFNGPAEYADPMNNTPKVVFSKTLLKAEWKESRIARGDLTEEIARLRSEPGKDRTSGTAQPSGYTSRSRVVDDSATRHRAASVPKTHVGGCDRRPGEGAVAGAAACRRVPSGLYHAAAHLEWIRAYRSVCIRISTNTLV